MHNQPLPPLSPPPPTAPPAPPARRARSGNYCYSATPPSATPYLDCGEHLWAIDHPDVHKAVYVARVCRAEPPKACRLLDIPAILQEGPTCGLVALSMLVLGTPSPAQLLAVARRAGYTRNGEMLSAANMMQLVRDTRNDAADAADGAERVWLHSGSMCDADGGELDGNRIKQTLLQGGCLLVPYDADFIHQPCLRNGHSAHWALIIGYLIDEDDCFHVFARHGKSKNISVWPLHELILSNSQLVEFKQPRGSPDTVFELPAGGIGGELGLRRRCIVIERMSGEADRDGFGVARIVIR